MRTFGKDFYIEDEPEGRTLFVTSDWSEEAAKAVLRDGIDGLALGYAHGFRERDLRFLEGLPVRRLRVVARTLNDLEPIYSLAPTLEKLLLVTGSSSRVDVARLPELTDLEAGWGQIAETIHRAVKLESLYIEGYGERDLSPLLPIASLRHLVMKDRPYLETFDGLEALERLESLEIFLAPRLRDFAGLWHAPPSLRILDLGSCKGLTNLDFLAHVTGLVSLGIANCGLIESLAPIAGSSNLVKLFAYEDTTIEDKDLSPLLKLPRFALLAMMNRRGYRPSTGEIKEAIAGRPGGD